MLAAMMYAAVEGRPMPMTIHASMIINSIRKRFPPDTSKTMLVNFTPMPVMLTMPITIPAHAQAIATGTVVFAAVISASTISFKGNRFCVISVLVMPTASKATIAKIAA